MNAETKTSDTNLAALIHLSTFSKYIIPFGNFIFPLVIWSSRKNDPLIEAHGREALNFQISLILYMVFIAAATVSGIILIGTGMEDGGWMIFQEHRFRGDLLKAIPILITVGVAGILMLGLFFLELVCVITATLKASEGKYYSYPLSIPFIISSNQSKNEPSKNTQKETL